MLDGAERATTCTMDSMAAAVLVRPMEVDQLKRFLDDGGQRRPFVRTSVLLIDSRSFLAFNAGHIRTAHNVHWPPIVRRRWRQCGSRIPLENIVRCPDSRERLVTGKYDVICVYDDSTWSAECLSVDVLPEMERPLERSAGIVSAEDSQKNDLRLVLESLCNLLPRYLVENLFYLNGGFDCFSNLHQHIVSSEIISANTATITSSSSSSSSSSPSNSSSSSGVCVPNVTDLIGMSAQNGSKACKSTNCSHQIAEIFNGQQRTLKAVDTVKWHSSKDKGNPTEILPWLYLGNAYHAHQEDSLRKLEIRALLNVAEVSSVSVSPLPTDVFCHMNLPIADSATSDISGKFPQAIEFIENVRMSGGKVLVHCLAGISRSPAICMAYLMFTLHLTLDDAHDYLKARRHFISPNLNFMRQLVDFENLLSSDRQRDAVVVGRCTLAHLRPQSQSADPANPPSSSHSGRLMDSSKVTPPPQSGTVSAEERSLSRKRPRPTSLSFSLPCSSSTCSVPMTPCTKQAGFGFDFSSVAAGLKLSPSVVSHSPLLPPI